jgi:heptosyltransferase-2
MLADCTAAVCNDSGGMHLAASVGCPLVAIFGRTDPRVTGPLGGRCTIVQAGGGGQRDIGRDDAGAVQALAGISPDRIYDALETLLQGTR